jgi:conjugal transfer pilus assembly protein TraB
MKQFFDKLTPKHKRLVVFLFGIFLVFFVVYQLVSTADKGQNKIQKTIEEYSKKYPNILSTSPGDRKFTMEKLQSQNRLLKEENSTLKDANTRYGIQLEAIVASQKALKETLDSKDAVISKTDIERIVKEYFEKNSISDPDEPVVVTGIGEKENQEVTVQTTTEGKIDDFGKRILHAIKQTDPEKYYPNAYENHPVGQNRAREIVITGGNTDSPSFEEEFTEKLKQDQENQTYIPTGTNMKGIVISGIAAPTAGSAQRNPLTLFIMLTGEATLPNRYKIDMDSSIVMASGYGDLSSQRAYIRTEQLSRVLEDGRVIDIEMYAVVVGEDGQLGMKGPFKSYDGQLMAKALAAGTLSGFADALRPTAVLSLQTDPADTQTYQTPNLDTLLESGAYKGASTALEMAAQRYLKIAEAMHPTIEIQSGREIELQVTKGFYIKTIGEGKS